MIKTATCTTCGCAVPVSFGREGHLCPTCLVVASLNPESAIELDREAGALASSWSETFPQLVLQEVLWDEAEWYAWEAIDLDHGGRSCVLQVVCGAALEQGGGSAALLARANRLRGLALPGLARVLDAGDLTDAFFLVTARDAAWVPVVEPDTLELESDTGAVVEQAVDLLTVLRQEGLTTRFELRAAYRAPETGRLILTPSALPAEADEAASWSQFAESFQPAAGTLLDVFQLKEKVGEGGFGEVWRASQERPVKRQVALKILKSGLATPRLLARFEVEQQALARLDHPHIARFYDGEITPDGRPFFAMEWVEGQSITNHCDAKKAPREERLRLFRELCEAVQHAHQKGILHRDLKASNVLVAAEHNSSSVKVIDFGIARAIEEPLIDQTLLTRAEEVLGTPATMSPEQAGGSDLDARTDVYGLGVLLYQLLAGRLPFDPDLPPDELRRHIREDDPQRPSVVVEREAERRALRGDLDWIVMRCLEKDPARRYPSVGALLQDLERHDRDEAVEAGPPDRIYRLRKFARRHRMALGLASVIVLSTVAVGLSLAFALHSAREGRAAATRGQEAAEREAAVADAANRFLVEELLTFEEENGLLRSNPRDRDVRLRTVLLRAANRIEGRYDSFPEVEAVLRESLSSSFFALGDFDEAESHAQQAIALWERASPQEEPRHHRVLQLLASIYAAQGRFEPARTVLAELGELDAQQLASESIGLQLAESRLLEAEILLEMAYITEAETIYRQLKEVSEVPVEIQVSALSGLARILQQRGEREDSLAMHAEASTRAIKELGERDPTSLEIARLQALAIGDQEDNASNEEIQRFVAIARRVKQLQEEVLGSDHPDTLRTRFDFAFAFGGVPALAPTYAKELSEIVTIAEDIYHSGHPELLRFRVGLARQHTRDGDHSAAIKELEAVIENAQRSVGERHPVVIEAERLLGESHAALGNPDAAVTHFRAAVDYSADLSFETRVRRDAVMALGQYFWNNDRTPEALALFREAYLGCLDELGPDNRHTARFLDSTLISLYHNRTAAAARNLANIELGVGGTEATVDEIRALFGLSMAAHLSMQPTHFTQDPLSLPEAWYELIRWDGGLNKVPPPVFKSSARWRYRPITDRDAAPTGWETATYDDRAWREGPAPFGFGEGGVSTNLLDSGDLEARPHTVCLRRFFTVNENADPQRPLLLRVARQGNLKVSLNGTELVNLKGEEDPDPVTLFLPGEALRPGRNLVTVTMSGLEDAIGPAFSLELRVNARRPLEVIAELDLAGAQRRLEKWLPGIPEPLESDWRERAECVLLASMGKWEDALEKSRGLPAPDDAAATARLRWFQRTCLERLVRFEEADDEFRASLPPREPSAEPHLLDLTPHYNGLLDECWFATIDGIAHEAEFKDFPVGTGAFDGLSFDARGVIQLSSPRLESMGLVGRFPRAVNSIVVDQRVAGLHFLNGCLFHAEAETVVAGVLVHYDDGSQASFPIRYGIETQTARIGNESPYHGVNQVWRAPDPYREGSDKALFVASWKNPEPEKVVRSIDLRAADSSTALFVVGITAEPAP